MGALAPLEGRFWKCLGLDLELPNNRMELFMRLLWSAVEIRFTIDEGWIFDV
jgi:hypothetical protein